jgi:hypothetical protein
MKKKKTKENLDKVSGGMINPDAHFEKWDNLMFGKDEEIKIKD